MTVETVETVAVDVVANLKPFSNDMKLAQKEADMLGQRMTSALGDILSGTKSIEESFRSLSLDIAKSAFNAGIAPLKSMLSGAISEASGGLFSMLGGAMPVKAFAKGGVVNSPTTFPMQSSMGLMGEAGAEAILPLSRGPDGRLGVGSQGQAAGRPVSIVMNISTPDAQSFAKSENQIATKLARAVGRGRHGL